MTIKQLEKELNTWHVGGTVHSTPEKVSGYFMAHPAERAQKTLDDLKKLGAEIKDCIMISVQRWGITFEITLDTQD